MDKGSTINDLGAEEIEKKIIPAVGGSGDFLKVIFLLLS